MKNTYTHTCGDRDVITLVLILSNDKIYMWYLGDIYAMYSV